MSFSRRPYQQCAYRLECSRNSTRHKTPSGTSRRDASCGPGASSVPNDRRHGNATCPPATSTRADGFAPDANGFPGPPFFVPPPMTGPPVSGTGNRDAVSRAQTGMAAVIKPLHTGRVGREPVSSRLQHWKAPGCVNKLSTKRSCCDRGKTTRSHAFLDPNGKSPINTDGITPESRD